MMLVPFGDQPGSSTNPAASIESIIGRSSMRTIALHERKRPLRLVACDLTLKIETCFEK